ncbi:MAG: glycosyltransferase 87 family protein [Hyphomicrobium sp.]
MAGWTLLGLLVTAFAIALTAASPRFGYAYEVAEMPILALVAGLVLAGLIFCFALPPLIAKSLNADAAALRLFMAAILVAGLAARLVLFASEPMLEDDYQRYLWDGAVTVSGHNPYALSPYAARQPDAPSIFGRIAEEAGAVARRINHPELKTIYPPVAQGAFALAYILKPWSLAAWRTVILICDIATLILILLLLSKTGRSPLWAALYWWNPVVLKELFNSAHMEAVVLPLVLLALLLMARGRQVTASISLAFAAGAKIWPVLLLPLVLRPLVEQKRKLAAALIIFGGLILMWATPVLLGGLDANSGFTAYVANWKTNSALFPALEGITATLLSALSLADVSAGRVARALIAFALTGLAFALSVKPLKNADDLMGRASLLVAALVLLSPAQFPWYVAWFAPFLAFRPWFGFLLLTATVPLYYIYFYFAAAGEPHIFKQYIVWIIWIPVWAALIFEAVRHRCGAQPT